MLYQSRVIISDGGGRIVQRGQQILFDVAYGEYQKARRDMQEIVTIKANIDTLMGYTEPGRKQEKER